MFFRILLSEFLQVQDLPAHCGKVCRLWQANRLEVWIPIVERKQKAHRLVVEAGEEVSREPRPRCFQLVRLTASIVMPSNSLANASSIPDSEGRTSSCGGRPELAT